MQKIDIAIQSYKKPESLIYTLFSLKQSCGELIDTIYINDDLSEDGTVDFYLAPELQEHLAPIKLKVRTNIKKGGFGQTLFTKEMKPVSYNHGVRWLKAHLTNNLYNENDIRYQWAINFTDKKYLMIVHDDIKFHKNIAQLYLDTFKTSNNLAIVGDLGICNVCLEKNCSPQKIMQGYRPSKYYPKTRSKHGPLPFFYRRGCRISEWCCMIDVTIARKIAKENYCYFGQMEDKGDTAAYWFYMINKLGYEFSDPIPTPEQHNIYYCHAWQGHSGHSVWQNEGHGQKVYQKEMIKNCIKNEFGYELK